MPEAAGVWWSVLPASQPSVLIGSSAERIRSAFDPLPDRAPAVIFLWPSVVRPFRQQLLWLLDEMDRVALRLLDRWLPSAGQLTDASPMAVAAVEALAKHLAGVSSHNRSFIADLARRALLTRFGAHEHRKHLFAAEVRAAGLVRALAAAYGRDSVTVLIDVPTGLTKQQQRALAGAAMWFCQHSSAAVWFAGASLDQVDTLLAVPIALGGLQDLPAEDAGGFVTEPVLVFPAIAGQPRADSEAELALEEELRHHQWAAMRRWNHPFNVPGGVGQYRLDLFWDAERLVVEVDGEDHRTKAKYAADRVRDVTLILLGYQVVRFTNDLVLGHVKPVVDQIRQLLFTQQDRVRTAQEA